MPGDRPEVPRVLAQVALERARVLAPVVLVAVTAALLLSEQTNIPLSWPVIAYNLVIIAAMGSLTAALLLRRVPERFAHWTLAFLWWTPVASTLVSLYFSQSELLVLLLVLETSTAAMMLHSGFLVASFVMVDAVFGVIVARQDSRNALLYVVVLATTQLFAVLLHALMRQSLVRAETHRFAEAQTARELAHQLEELKHSEDERAKLRDQLFHVQRMEAVGTLAAGLAHDMNNVLAAITTFTELSLRETQNPQARDDLRQVLREAGRGAELTRGLLAFARRGQYRKQTLEIEGVIADVVPLLARTLPKSIEIRTELALPNACIEGDATLLGQALVNLGLNAADAMNGAGTLRIGGDLVELDRSAAEAMCVAPGRYTRLWVIDTGSGMDQSTRDRVFEPFFTTKPIGKGTGLGLAVVWGAVQGHRGAITVDSAPGQGTTFWIYLPVTANVPTAKAIAKGSGEFDRRGTVLVVDDEVGVRTALARLLVEMGFAVIEAANGEEALARHAEAEHDIELVILDMGMPVMDGGECFRRLRERSSVPVLIATGYAVEKDAQSLVAAGAALLEKPFTGEALGREIERLLGISARVTA
jgi:signal transduction histidine kinase